MEETERIRCFLETIVNEDEERNYSMTHLLRYAAILEMLRRYLDRNANVLDLGTGFGHIALLVKHFLGCRVVAADAKSHDYYEPGTRRLPLMGIEFETGAEFSPGKSLPFKDGRFTCVLLCDVLEHVIDHPLHVFAEVNRILREHGIIVLTTPNICNIYNCMSLVSGQNPQRFLHELKYGSLFGHGHFREYTMAEVQWLLQSSMFRILEASYISTVGPFASVSRSAKLRLLYRPYRIINSIWPSRRDTLAVVGEKRNDGCASLS